MKRIIKFRAWDRREGVMREVQAIWGNGHVYVYCNCDEEGKFLYHRDKSTTGLPHHLNSNDVVLEEFTGLHDKNGKEIYEGDILSDGSICDDIGNQTRYSIGFTDGAFRIEDTNCTCGCIGTVVEGAMESEIIGNIHENHETARKETKHSKAPLPGDEG